MTALRNAIINSSCRLHQDTLNYSNILRNEVLNKTHHRRASVFVLGRLLRWCLHRKSQTTTWVILLSVLSPTHFLQWTLGLVNNCMFHYLNSLQIIFVLGCISQSSLCTFGEWQGSSLLDLLVSDYTLSGHIYLTYS